MWTPAQGRGDGMGLGRELRLGRQGGVCGFLDPRVESEGDVFFYVDPGSRPG